MIRYDKVFDPYRRKKNKFNFRWSFLIIVGYRCTTLPEAVKNGNLEYPDNLGSLQLSINQSSVSLDKVDKVHASCISHDSFTNNQRCRTVGCMRPWFPSLVHLLSNCRIFPQEAPGSAANCNNKSCQNYLMPLNSVALDDFRWVPPLATCKSRDMWWSNHALSWVAKLYVSKICD